MLTALLLVYAAVAVALVAEVLACREPAWMVAAAIAWPLSFTAVAAVFLALRTCVLRAERRRELARESLDV